MRFFFFFAFGGGVFLAMATCRGVRTTAGARKLGAVLTLPAGPGATTVPPGLTRSIGAPRAAGPGATWTPPGPVPPGV